MIEQEKTTAGEAVAEKTHLESSVDILTDNGNICYDVIEEHRQTQRKVRLANNEPSLLRRVPVEFISLNDIKPKPIQWLIPSVIPKGMITVLASDGGVGKTALSLWLASLVSNQGETFNGKPVEHGRVLIWSGEDSPEYVLSPRLRALGADADFVDIIGNRVMKPDGLRTFDITEDLYDVEESLQNRHKDTPYKLLIIDPVMSVVRGDSNQANTVRQALEPLRILAERQNIAVIGITHYSKGTSKSLPQDRVIGSQAFVALARMVLGLGKDEATGNRRLVVLKSNIVDTNIGYELSYQFFTDVDGCQVARIDLIDELHGSARELLSEIEPDEPETGAMAEAVEFLKGILSDGALPSKQVKSDADGAGHSWDTIKRASIRLKIEKRKDRGTNGVWRWALPAE
ncbi:MAG: AAA family ATPase [Oxalobacter sp.]|nr:AAA family ATPase [Oxalobacter sp.]